MKFTEEQIRKSCQAARLNLDGRDKRSFLQSGILSLSLWSLVFPAAPLLAGEITGPFGIVMLITTPIALSFAILLITVLKLLSLKMVMVQTPLKEKELRLRTAELSRAYKWKVQNNRKSLMVLTTGASSGGERITILHHEGRVWVNSICDPSRRLRWKSFHQNGHNIRLVQRIMSGSVSLRSKETATA